MGSGSRVAVIAALFGNLAIAILKLVAGLAAHSAAMLAEAAHSFSDVGNQLLLMLGLARARHEPTAEHPFGTGKSAYFWPMMVAVLLFGVAGAYSFIEGIEKFRHPHELGAINVSLGVLAAAFVIESGTLYVAVRAAKQGARRRGVRSVRQFLRENRDATLLTVLVEDSLALVGLPIAAAALIIATVTGDARWDGVGSFVIGILLMGFALFLGAEVRELLVGRGLAPRDLQIVNTVTTADPAVSRIRAVQSMYLGADAVLVGIEVELKDDVGDTTAEEVVDRLEHALRDALPFLRFIYIEPHRAGD